MGQRQRVLMLVNLAQEDRQVFGRSPFVRSPPHRIKLIAAHADAPQQGFAPFVPVEQEVDHDNGLACDLSYRCDRNALHLGVRDLRSVPVAHVEVERVGSMRWCRTNAASSAATGPEVPTKSSPGSV